MSDEETKNESVPPPQKNNTDYQFPDTWGLMTQEEKNIWFTQERCRRQCFNQGFRFTSRKDNKFRKK